MSLRGKLIVLEGIDGSGKRTQIEMLARALHSHKIAVARIGFPRYEGFFGRMVGHFLNGEFGPLPAVDPHFSGLLYAGDRLEAKRELEASLGAGKIVLADRYIGSNLAHQGARVPPPRRSAFVHWLKRLEYEIYGLPHEDLVIYLRLPPSEAHRMIGQKAARQYTKRKRDLQESSLAHLKEASAVYDALSRQPNWIRVECVEASPRKMKGGSAGATTLRTPEAIHQEILAAIDKRVLLGLAGRPRQ